ncbi:MAG: c-type cytochrome [Devosia sp.]
MKARAILVGATGLIGAVVLGWALIPGSSDSSRVMRDDAATLALGENVYQTACASCHGVNLEGEPNWRQRNADGRLPAPPHDESGHTWHHDSQTLFKITKYGLAALIDDPTYQSNMPIYEGVLTDEEISAVLSYIRSTWPEEIRQAYDEREAGR